MAAPADGGAVPLEEFAVLDSEVHHLIDDFREHKADARARFERTEASIEAVGKKVGDIVTELHGLNRSLKLIGIVLLALLPMIVAQVFTR